MMELTNDGSDDIETSDTSPLGGFIRGFLRQSIKAINALGSATIGRLPRLPNARTITLSAEKLGEAVDIREHVLTAHEDHGAKHADNKRALYAKVALQAVPNFIKSSILGTLVFSTYEYVVDDMEQIVLGVGLASHGRMTGAISLCGGAMAGLVHGCGALIWDRSVDSMAKVLVFVSSRWSSYIPQQLLILIPTITPSTVSAGAGVFAAASCFYHAVVHGVLFGTFTCTKLMFSKGVESLIITEDDPAASSGEGSNMITSKHDCIQGDHNPRYSSLPLLEPLSHMHSFVRFGGIIVGGLCAGVTAELASQYLAPLEQQGIRPVISGYAFRFQQRFLVGKLAVSSPKIVYNPLVSAIRLPPLKGLVVASVPSILGFLAFEYGKELM